MFNQVTDEDQIAPQEKNKILLICGNLCLTFLGQIH